MAGENGQKFQNFVSSPWLRVVNTLAALLIAIGVWVYQTGITDLKNKDMSIDKKIESITDSVNALVNLSTTATVERVQMKNDIIRNENRSGILDSKIEEKTRDRITKTDAVAEFNEIQRTITSQYTSLGNKIDKLDEKWDDKFDGLDRRVRRNENGRFREFPGSGGR